MKHIGTPFTYIFIKKTGSNSPKFIGTPFVLFFEKAESKMGNIGTFFAFILFTLF
ncbi:hypothetical protein BCF58_1711 [Chryseobacterium defluvii]|uniref:Uncharacterized protein n=1 Tax=Chryseobacterium defluvii TaxID=160396 RepID=A0A495SBH0_9FLAO|nr:hypothetical protein BCF58_1711 [Chryseobacterium defluvii]